MTSAVKADNLNQEHNMTEVSVNMISKAEFEANVVNSGTLTLVDFYADWCAPCKMITPVLEELAEEYEGRVNIVKLNADAEPEVLAQYGVRGLPTMMIFNQGKSVDTTVGAQPYSAIKKFIEKHL